MSKKLIALTGSPQSGKTENQETIVSAGFAFVNANDIGDAMRAEGSDLRAAFEKFVPRHGAFSPEGKRNSAYFMHILEHPAHLRLLWEIEREATIAFIQEALKTSANGYTTLINYEYWHWLLPYLTPDVIIHFECDEETHCARLNERAKVRGYTGPPIPNQQLMQLLEASQIAPMQIRQGLSSFTGEIILVDTSPSDWGAANLTAALHQLRA